MKSNEEIIRELMRNRRKGKSKKVESEPTLNLEPMAPSERDISEELEFLTNTRKG